MGKKRSDPDPSPDEDPLRGRNVSDDTWTKILISAAQSKDGDAWVAKALRNAENARHN
jgi:hypothetical protein